MAELPVDPLAPTLAVPAGTPAPDSPTLSIPVRVELGPEVEEPSGAPLRSTAGRYLVEGELGRGGMGVVYRAFDRDLRRRVAMKVVLAPLGDELSARFVEEAQATAQLQHPGIVPVYEIGLTEDKQLFFTMKLVRGRTLAQVVEDERVRPGEFSLFRLVQVVSDVARTVAYAHERGVLHRDLKPQNVMIGGFGEVLVLDWGLAKLLGRGAHPEEKKAPAGEEPSGVRVDGVRAATQAGSVVGTPGYMSPEQVDGDPARIGTAADVYALGAVLYHVLTGRAPHAGRTTKETLARVLTAAPERPRSLELRTPRALEAICLKALAKDPAARYASAKALALDLQAWLEDRSVSARPDGPIGRVVRHVRRNRAVAATLVASLALGTAGTVYALVEIDAARLRATVRALEAEGAAKLEKAARLDAERNLESALLEKADRALLAGDALGAEALFARALGLFDHPATREGLLRARGLGARLLRRTDRSDVRVRAVALTRDGSRAALATVEGEVRLADPATLEGRALEGLRNARSLAFSGDGARLAAEFTDGSARVLDLASGRILADVPGHSAPVWKVTLDRSGARLLTGAWDPDRTFRVVEVATGARIHVGSVPWLTTAIALSPDGGQAAVAGDSRGNVQLVDLATGRVAAVPGHGELVDALAFSPDGATLAAGSARGRVHLTRGGAPSEDPLVGPDVRIEGMAFSRDGRLLATTSTAGVQLWDVAARRARVLLRVGRPGQPLATALALEGERVFRLAAHDGVASSEEWAWPRGDAPLLDAEGVAAPSLDGTSVAVVGSAELVRWSPATGSAARSAGIPGARAVAPDLATVAACGSALELRTLDGALVRSWAGPGTSYDARFSPDGRVVASCGGRDGWVRAFEVATGRELFARDVGPRAQGLALSARGSLAFGVERTVHVVDLATGRETETAPLDPLGWASELAFSPDGARLAVHAGAVWILDASTGAAVARLTRHPGAASGMTWALAWSPDGKLVATGTSASASPGRSSGFANVHDAASGHEIVSIPAHPESVSRVAFLRDGWLLTSGHDATVRAWDLAEARRLAAARPEELLRESENRTGFGVDGVQLVPRR